MQPDSLLLFQKALGERVRVHRLARRLTQAELGELAGTAEAIIWRIEAGRQNVNLKTLYRLALALDVSLVSLVPEIPKPAADL